MYTFYCSYCGDAAVDLYGVCHRCGYTSAAMPVSMHQTPTVPRRINRGWIALGAALTFALIVVLALSPWHQGTNLVSAAGSHATAGNGGNGGSGGGSTQAATFTLPALDTYAVTAQQYNDVQLAPTVGSGAVEVAIVSLAGSDGSVGAQQTYINAFEHQQAADTASCGTDQPQSVAGGAYIAHTMSFCYSVLNQDKHEQWQDTFWFAPLQHLSSDGHMLLLLIEVTSPQSDYQLAFDRAQPIRDGLRVTK